MDSAALPSAGHSAASGASQSGEAARLDARGSYRLLEACRELVVERLSAVVVGALDRMTAELTDAALALGKSARKRTLLDTVLVVRQQRTTIEQAFRRLYGDIFERRLFAQPLAAAEPVRNLAAGNAGNAGNVGATPVPVLVANLAGRVRRGLDADQVLGVRARLGVLLERDWFEDARQPVAPEAIFDALAGAIDAALHHEERVDVREALLAAFEPHLTRHLNAIYIDLNARLVAHQILPQLAGARAPASATPPGPSGPAAPARPPALGRPASSFRALEEALARGGVDQGGLRGAAARILSDPGTFGMADLPLEPVRPLLLEALEKIQHDSAGVVAPSELFPALAEQAGATGSPLDRMTVELVSLVFEHIQADTALAESVRRQLMRLQVVAVRAALLDRSFFARREHPMRELIDGTTELAADPDADLADGSPLLLGIQAVFGDLIAGFDRDLGAFERAIEQIDRLCGEEAERRAAVLAKELARAEHEEVWSLALERARRDLEPRLDEAVPAFIRGFLLTWWTPALARDLPLPRLAAGPGAAMKAAELLIWSVAAKHPEEIARLAELVPKLIASLVEGSQVAEMPASARTAFFEELLSAHTAVIDQAKRWQVGQPDPRPARVRLRPDGTVRFSRGDGDPEDHPMTVSAGETILGGFARGDRIELTRDSGEAAIYKLAWISPARKLFILSRYPEEALSLSAAQFSALVFNEKARRVDGPQAVDDAIDVLTRKAAVPATPSQGLPG